MLTAYTEYFGSIEQVSVISYDRNKYCTIIRSDNEQHEIKSGYLYRNKTLSTHIGHKLYTVPKYDDAPQWSKKKQSFNKKKHINQSLATRYKVLVYTDKPLNTLYHTSVYLTCYYVTMVFKTQSSAVKFFKRMEQHPNVLSLMISDCNDYVSHAGSVEYNRKDDCLYVTKHINRQPVRALLKKIR